MFYVCTTTTHLYMYILHDYLHNDVRPVESVSDCCLTPNEQYFSYIIWREQAFQLDAYDLRFELDQHA